MYDYDDYDGVDLKKTIKDSMKELAQESQHEQARIQTEARQKEANEMVEAACKEAGISVEYFNQFIMDKNVFQDQVRQVAFRAAKAKGRKPQHKESAGDQAFQISQPTSVMGRHPRNWKEKYSDPKQRTGTDTEVLDMLTDLIGNDDAFKVTR